MIVRMSTAQITAFQPLHGRTYFAVDESLALKPSTLRFPFTFSAKARLSLKCSHLRALVPRGSSSVVCSSTSGADSDSQGAPWKAFEKALSNITKKPSVEELLKQQIEKKEYFSGTGGGESGGGSGGGGGGGGGDESSGEGTDDEGEDVWDEALQVFLATSGFIFMYIYIINGEEMQKLARDYVIYLVKGSESVRLKRIKTQVRDLWNSVKPLEIEDDPYWLEREIINTRTQYDAPQKYRDFFGPVAEPTLGPDTGEPLEDFVGGDEVDFVSDSDSDDEDDPDDI